MNGKDENVDPMRDAASDVEHLRLGITENGEVLYRNDEVTRCQQLLLCFFCEQERGREAEGSFFFFQSFQRGFLRSSRLLVFLSE